MLIGAYGDGRNQTTIANGLLASSNNSDSFAGAIYIYRSVGAIWCQYAYTKATNGGAGDAFGYSYALHLGTAVVGAYVEDSTQTGITMAVR